MDIRRSLWLIDEAFVSLFFLRRPGSVLRRPKFVLRRSEFVSHRPEYKKIPLKLLVLTPIAQQYQDSKSPDGLKTSFRYAT